MNIALTSQSFKVKLSRILAHPDLEVLSCSRSLRQIGEGKQDVKLFIHGADHQWC